MSDPMSWALPLFRAFGVLVRMHILYPVLMIGLILRIMTRDGNVVTLFDAVLLVAVIPFFVILFHEFGHVFAGRSVGGDSEDILMWPLGGLAFVSTPKEWKAHTVTAAGGPFVNVLICFATAVMLAWGGFIPTLNPVSNPFILEVKNYNTGQVFTSEYELRMYVPETAAVMHPAGKDRLIGKPEDVDKLAAAYPQLQRTLAPEWVTWTNRVFWVSWVLLLFNLIPAYPLDGGQILQGLIWWRSDYARGTIVACASGYAVGILFLIVSLATNESAFMGLGMFVLFQSWMRLRLLAMEAGEYGGDFSNSYGNPADDDEDAPRKPPRKPGFLKRWRQARAARREQRDQDERTRDDERMDELLAKINRDGRQSLTPEENAFMQRVSQRYRKQ